MAGAPDSSADALTAMLPGTLGNLRNLLAQIAWADPDLVRFSALTFSGAVEANIDPVASAPVTGVAKSYFFVFKITGYVEQDPGAAVDESANAQDVFWQLRDEDRNLDIWDESICMADLCGTGLNPVPTPIDCDAAPLVLLPKGTFVVTWSTNADFANAAGGPPTVTPAHSVTGLTTRKVKITMYGAMVAESIVDKLLDINRQNLITAGLIGSRMKR